MARAKDRKTAARTHTDIFHFGPLFVHDLWLAEVIAPAWANGMIAQVKAHSKSVDNWTSHR